MGYGIALRERFPLVRFLVNAQKTVWYPIAFAILCIISGTHNRFVYLPIIFVLCSFVIFSALFADDNKVFIVPLLMIYFSLGRDYTSAIPGTGSDLLTSSFDPSAFTHIIVMGAITVVAFVARLVADGSFAAATKQRRIGALSILVLDAALMLNGIFNPDYTPMNLLYGFIIAAAFTLFYFAVSGMLRDSRDFIPYACKTAVAAAYVALGQFAVILLQLWQRDALFKYGANNVIIGLNRDRFVLSWGLSTMIGAVFVLGIPAALYLARNHKFCVFSYGSALLFLVGTVVINTRSAMLVGGVAMLVGAAICCLKNKNNKKNAVICRIMSIFLVLGIAFAAYKLISSEETLQKLLKSLRLVDYSESTRLVRWEMGWNDFLRLPVFGAGFDTGSNINNNVFSSMYHCIIIEFLGAMGVFGTIAFVFHCLCLGKICFVKGSFNKFLLMLLPLVILAMSLVDNFFFYPFFQIFYCVFMVLAENYDGQRKPQEIAPVTDSPSAADAY